MAFLFSIRTRAVKFNCAIIGVVKKKNVKKRIGFDLDGVLADHAENIKKTAERMGLKKGSLKVKKEIYGELSLTAGVIRGAQKAVKNLIKNSEIFIVSRRRSESRKVAGEWLKKYFDFAPENIFFVDEDKDKADIIKKLGLDFYIDDKMSVLLNIKGRTRKFLFDEAGIYKKERYGGIKVVRSFEEFLEELNRLE